jgi:hypothetical protein
MPDPVDTAAGELKIVPDPRFRPYWPITTLFREALGREESRGGYLARHPKTNALGAYQLTPVALEDIGWKDRNGAWTEKSGITDDNAFLLSPLAQETALKQFLALNWQRLQGSGLDQQVGQIVHGQKGDFTLTQNGLVAAIHRSGEPTVEAYLKDMLGHDWVSDKDRWTEEQQKVYLPLETRLRKFANIPYLRFDEH